MHIDKEQLFSYSTVIIVACFSLQAVGLGNLIAYGVFINPLLDEFNWSRAAVSGASSVAIFFGGVFGVLVGHLNDKIGPRLVTIVCAFFFGFGHIIMSQIGALWQLYLVYGLFIGVGMGSVDIIPLSTIAHWFREKRGAITGIVKVGAGFGQLVIPLAASILITRHGWRTSYIVLGIGSFVLFFIIGLLLKRAPQQELRSNQKNIDRSSDTAQGNDSSFSFREAVRTKTFWIICISNMLGIFSLMTIMVHIVPHATLLIDSPTRAAGVVSTIGFSSMLGRFLMGLVIDRIGTKKSTILCYGLLILTLLWLQAAKAPWMLYLFAVFDGIAHGGVFTIISPIVAEFFGIKSHGSLFGIVVFASTTGGAAGPLISGRIFDIAGSYYPAFWMLTIISIIGLVLISMLKPVPMVSYPR